MIKGSRMGNAYYLANCLNGAEFGNLENWLKDELAGVLLPIKHLAAISR